MSMTGYQCIACSTTQPLDFRGYTCPKCGGNLDIVYDYKGFDRSAPFASSLQNIFRFESLLPIRDSSLAPPLRVGLTPLYHAKRLGASIGLRNVYLKDDGLNPSASFKDRASAVALVRAREIGARVVAGATTGNAGSSMACLSASVEMPCVIFVPEKAPPAKIAQLLVFGARVLAVRGSYDQAFDLCVATCKQRGWFNRNTGSNPFTREGKKTCSFEIWEQLGKQAPDRIVVPTGDGNIISGIWKGIRDLKAVGLITNMPKIDCAQSTLSAAVSNTVRGIREKKMDPRSIDWKTIRIDPVKATTVADSISVDVPRDGLAAVRAVVESGGEPVTVTDEEILAAILELARLAGVFAEPAAACSWAALKKMAKDGLVQPDERVVCLLTGNGLKDVASARKVAGEPVTIDPTPEAAERALDKMGVG